ELPVLGDAGSPADLAEKVRADHVSGPRDHLQRADRVLERALDHVAAGVLGPHRLRQPAFGLVQNVPLIALHRGDFLAALDRLLARLAGIAIAAAAVSFLVVEVRQKTVDRIRERYRVGVEADHVLGARIHDLERLSQRSPLVALTAGAMEDLESRGVRPAFEDEL